jgi:hypothetical protein
VIVGGTAVGGRGVGEGGGLKVGHGVSGHGVGGHGVGGHGVGGHGDEGHGVGGHGDGEHGACGHTGAQVGEGDTVAEGETLGVSVGGPGVISGSPSRRKTAEASCPAAGESAVINTRGVLAQRRSSGNENFRAKVPWSVTMADAWSAADACPVAGSSRRMKTVLPGCQSRPTTVMRVPGRPSVGDTMMVGCWPATDWNVGVAVRPPALTSTSSGRIWQQADDAMMTSARHSQSAAPGRMRLGREP